MDDIATKDRAFSEDGSCLVLGISNREKCTPSEDETSSFGASSVEDENMTVEPSDPAAHAKTDDVENRYFGRSENRYVRNLKALVFLVLFLVTLAVCLVIYFLTDKAQQDEFQASFDGSASRIVQSFENILEQKIAAIAAFGVTVTASAIANNSTWPFVTVDQFQQRSASSRSLSGCLFLQMAPIITDDTRVRWEEYSNENRGWLMEARLYQAEKSLGLDHGEPVPTLTTTIINPVIVRLDEAATSIYADPGPGPYYPIWQSAPILPDPLILVNLNLGMFPQYRKYINASVVTGQIAIGGLDTPPPGGISDQDASTRLYANIISFEAGKPVNYTGEPFSTVYVPVVDSFAKDRKTVAIITAAIRWRSYLEGILSDSTQPMHVVLSNTCEGAFTFKVLGAQATFVGKGNLASPKYNGMAMSVELDENDFIIEPNTIALTMNQDLCRYTMYMYPTEEGEEYHKDFFPLVVTLTVAAVFLMTATVFYFYDVMVERRQKVVLDTAQRSTAIVSSIFPKNVRDQLLQAPVQGNATKLRFLADARKRGQEGGIVSPINVDLSSGPIADLFPNCTVMFADVEGFTAWSSVREPSQVFTLLETVYNAYDRVAMRRRVFKVETVGDCYVAVSGLPEPREDHAVTMAQFARDCIVEHTAAVKKLESSLGPDTGDLRLRVGLHSGPITAGVLRGERSRFQLFGDTVNTAARVESSGEGNRIHLSAYTAELIKNAGFERWIEFREGAVSLKGKGCMQTYWLVQRKKERMRRDRAASHDCSFSESQTISMETKSAFDTKLQRLVSFNADALLRVIKQIVARREPVCHPSSQVPVRKIERTNPLAEVVEVIELPRESKTAQLNDPNSLDDDPKIVALVYKYVTYLADMYPNNHFHNFEHASHVTMSVTKLLSRIVAPSDMDFADDVQASAKLHDHTYGITSDPLTQFACVLSALIHDVDHPGVSNATLVAEGNKLMNQYGNKSLAEQNSVDLAWDLLMTEQFQPLVSVLCRDESELCRLRQLVVNSVMATDIMDPDLKKLRNGRWEKAFQNTNVENQDTSQEAVNRKATIVIEHLIQASDVAHTMQHWNVYTKWNARLFKEMYKAYLDGRSGAKDPSEFWAKGEIGFFDFYIIPLAKKLKECGVFGVSSDEYLQYAISNRNEWEEKGDVMTQRIMEEVRDEYGINENE